MGPEESKFLLLRQQMVDRQLRRRGIRNESVLRAFLETPRERFVPPELQHDAYEDCPLPIGHAQTISQPYVVALMVQELAPEPVHRILDVGTGSGYQTAILARLAGHVYAVERIPDLTERAIETLGAINLSNVTFQTADGTLGWPEEAPFDRVICGAAAPEVPQAWIDQLADDGRIVLPLGGPEVQVLTLIEKSGGRLRRRELCEVRFVRLIGRHGWSEPA